MNLKHLAFKSRLFQAAFLSIVGGLIHAAVGNLCGCGMRCEAVRRAQEGTGQRRLSLFAYLGRAAGMDALWRHYANANAAVAVMVVVPSKEPGAVSAGIGHQTEASVLHTYCHEKIASSCRTRPISPA